jgi:flagellin
MSFSIQTNVNSLVAQNNLRVNSAFQSNTIQQLTSGFRINSSGDDAAGLAVANRFRSDVAELTQGVRNANDGVGQLQIADGGLNNISSMLDRLKTLATQSASSTFTGDRGTLANEYNSLLGEINREASNIGLVQGGNLNQNLKVYIGGGSSQPNAEVSVDLSGTANQVDSSGLGLASTSISGGGTTFTGNTTRLDNTAASFLATSGNQVFTFQVYDPTSGGSISKQVTVSGSASGLTGQQFVDALNAQLQVQGLNGITASVASTGAAIGTLQLTSSSAFSVSVGAASAGTGAVSGAGSASNAALYSFNEGNASFGATATGTETDTFANGNGSVSVSFDATSGASVASAIQAINAKTASLGIYATLDSAGTGISIQSGNAFTITKTAASATATENILGVEAVAGTQVGVGNIAVAAPANGAGGGDNALNALTAIASAVTYLGQVQGRVGAGENQLADSISLAQSQITNFSSAESQIRDADVAQEAANLTKAQVLQQASIAAMAQANSAPQQILTLLRG